MKKRIYGIFLAASLLFFSAPVYSFPTVREIENRHPVYSTQNGLISYISEHYPNYRKALVLFEEVVEMMDNYDCPESPYVAAVIFPELMRYSEYRDHIEAVTTELMYSAGVEYFNCSIGYMQMKPIFCVDVEQRIAANPVLKQKYSAIDFGGKEDTVEARYQRVVRMKRPETQCIYLMAFVDICRNLYNLDGKDIFYDLKIISTAYNCGIKYNVSQLEYISTLTAFPSGTGNAASRWIYGSIATDFYRAYLDGILDTL